jgi:chromosome segregation ATPase
VLQFDEDNQKHVFTKLEYCWNYLQEVGKYCQRTFESAGIDLANFRETFDKMCQQLPQNFRQISECMHEAETRNDSKFLHLHDSLQRLSGQMESCSSALLHLQQQLHARDSSSATSSSGGFVSMDHFTTLSATFHESQHRIMQLCDETEKFRQFQSQANENFAPHTYVRQLEERLSRLEQKTCYCDANRVGLSNLSAKVAEMAQRQDSLQLQLQSDIGGINSAIAGLQQSYSALSHRVPDISGIQTAIGELQTRYASVSTKITEMQSLPAGSSSRITENPDFKAFYDKMLTNNQETLQDFCNSLLRLEESVNRNARSTQGEITRLDERISVFLDKPQPGNLPVGTTTAL